MSNVDSPSHYNVGSIEVIDAIDDWELGFYEGNIVKYVARAKHKGDEVENLKKAKWYLNRLIDNLSPNNDTVTCRISGEINMEKILDEFDFY